MWRNIVGIGLVALLTVALVGGSAYILLRPDGGSVLHAGNGHGDGREAAARSGRGHGYGAEANPGDRDHPAETWTTVTGTVVALDPDLVLRTGEGEEVIHLGPEWYRESAGFSLALGDQVAVTGFYGDHGFEAVSVENLTTGQTLTLRDGAGRPAWAGQGNANGAKRGE